MPTAEAPDATLYSTSAVARLEDLPAELSPAQLEAWIRLAALLDDEGLLETLRLQHQPFDESVTPDARAAFGAQIGARYGRIYPLVAENALPADPRVRALATEYVALFTQTLGCADDAEFRRWLLAYTTRTTDPRIERFWNDVAVLRGRPAMPAITGAQTLLANGVSLLVEEAPGA